MSTAVVSNRLVEIASYVNVAEADLARTVLALGGIRAFLGNDRVVQWCWYYSNLSGGVKTLVADGDVDRAQEILADIGWDRSAGAWGCAGCGENIGGGWDICWRCGTSSAGLPDQDFLRHRTRLSPRLFSAEVIGLVALAAGLALIVTQEIFAVMFTLWVILLAYLLLAHGVDDDTDTTQRDARQGAAPGGVLSPAQESEFRRRRMGDEVTARMWRAAVFGLFSFPPLLLYSFYLWRRLARHKMPISRENLYRYRMAIALNLLFVPIAVLACCLVLGMSWWQLVCTVKALSENPGDFFW